LRVEKLCKLALNTEEFWDLFDYVGDSNFEVGSDAFASMSEMLTKHKALAATFLEENYARFFEKYNKLLESNYATKRQSLQLLCTILLERANFRVMSQYISSKQNLMLMMNLLRDEHKQIQFEAFHVFKVFVANPNKPPEIEDILLRNQERLINYLQHFRNELDDEQFIDEKKYLIKQIHEMQQKADK